MRIVRRLARYPLVWLTVAVLIAVLSLDAAGATGTAKWLAIVYVGGVIAWTLLGMIRDVLRGHVGLDILAVVAMIATLAVGEYVASLVIVLMLSGGEALEDYAG